MDIFSHIATFDICIYISIHYMSSCGHDMNAYAVLGKAETQNCNVELDMRIGKYGVFCKMFGRARGHDRRLSDFCSGLGC